MDNGNGDIKDLSASKPEDLKDALKPESNVLKIEIEFSEKTGIRVVAPSVDGFYNEMVCDYLMKKASRFIENYNMQKEKQKIISANPGIINRFTKGAFGKRG